MEAKLPKAGEFHEFIVVDVSDEDILRPVAVRGRKVLVSHRIESVSAMGMSAEELKNLTKRVYPPEVYEKLVEVIDGVAKFFSRFSAEFTRESAEIHAYASGYIDARDEVERLAASHGCRVKRYIRGQRTSFVEIYCDLHRFV
jgi:hypothetical protein